MKFNKNDFVGPFLAHTKPARDGMYWSTPSQQEESLHSIFKFGQLQKTEFKKGEWVFRNLAACSYQDRQWIGLTKAAHERIKAEQNA